MQEDVSKESQMNEIFQEINSAIHDMGRIWKYLDKIECGIKWKDSVGIVSGEDGELVGVAHHAGSPKNGEELESVMDYAKIAKQGVEEVENTLRKIDEMLENYRGGGECEAQ